MCLESGDREQTYLGLRFRPTWYGGILNSLMLLSFLLFVPVRVIAHCVRFVFCVLLRSFLVFLVFFDLSFNVVLYLGLLSPLGSGGVEGQHCWNRVMRGVLPLIMLGGSSLFPVLSFVTAGRCIIEKPRRGVPLCLCLGLSGLRLF